MAVTASFTPGAGLLSVIADSLANTVSVGRNAAGTLFVNNGAAAVLGGAPAVANTSQIQVFGLGANDTLFFDEASGALPRALLFGGTGNDTATGGPGADQLFGQGDNDALLGRGGTDLLFGGDGDDQMFGEAGNDRMVWNPGDGGDIVEGQAGFDALGFNGDNANETIDISALGSRIRFFRDVGNVSMDLDGVERIDFRASGGQDTVRVNDLSGTDLREVRIDLSPAGGDSRGQPDTVVVNGTFLGADSITVGGGGTVTVTGLAVSVTITGFDVADRLVIDGLGGNDVVNASGLGAGGLLFTANGGDGDDVLIGGSGIDTLNGDAGDDVLVGGGAVDVLDGGAGNNVVIQ